MQMRRAEIFFRGVLMAAGGRGPGPAIFSSKPGKSGGTWLPFLASLSRGNPSLLNTTRPSGGHRDKPGFRLVVKARNSWWVKKQFQSYVWNIRYKFLCVRAKKKRLIKKILGTIFWNIKKCKIECKKGVLRKTFAWGFVTQEGVRTDKNRGDEFLPLRGERACGFCIWRCV